MNSQDSGDLSRNKKVMVGMSGGVDSAVAAALLDKAGYDVTGVFIKVWQPEWIECTWRDELRDAMRAAAHLGIPFRTIDLEAEYKREVIDYMIREYAAGRTPNPDVMCNRHVKFGAFWKWAEKQGADFIATGHYARICGASSKGSAPYSLYAGVDTNKDQSYFLWTLNQKDLRHVLFPVGGLAKPEVRKIAKKLHLPNALKKDSQGLCFIGKLNIKEFLSHYISTEPGHVLNESGDLIGRHPGALLFTIGERHGFTLESGLKTPYDEPHYVIEKDVDQNTITVSNKDLDESLPSRQRQVRIGHVNWVSGNVPDFIAPSEARENSAAARYPLQARSRYRATLQNIRIVSPGITETILEFEKPQDTLTPGQSLVLYRRDECLGGGVIE